MTVHKELAAGRWHTLPLAEQLANIGSEVERALSWRDRNRGIAERAFERALELLDLTLADPRHAQRLRELARLRELLADYFAFDNEYGSTPEWLRKYFRAFNYAARLGR
jgi:hypothetical protein